MAENIAKAVGFLLFVAVVVAIIGEQGIVELWQMLVGAK